MAEAPVVDSSNESEGSGLTTFVAIMIALTTVIGALVAWRASVSDDAAGDADYAGLHAAASFQDARANSRLHSYEDYSIFLNYYRNKQLNDGLEGMLEKASGGRERQIKYMASETADLATSSLNLLDEVGASRYLKRDGTFAFNRDVGARMAEASRKENLDYASQFKEADELRAKTLRYLMAVVILALSLVAFTLVENFEGPIAYVFVAIGMLTMIGGTVFAVMVELGK